MMDEFDRSGLGLSEGEKERLVEFSRQAAVATGGKVGLHDLLMLLVRVRGDVFARTAGNCDVNCRCVAD